MVVPYYHLNIYMVVMRYILYIVPFIFNSDSVFIKKTDYFMYPSWTRTSLATFLMYLNRAGPR